MELEHNPRGYLVFNPALSRTRGLWRSWTLVFKKFVCNIKCLKWPSQRLWPCFVTFIKYFKIFVEEKHNFAHFLPLGIKNHITIYICPAVKPLCLRHILAASYSRQPIIDWRTNRCQKSSNRKKTEPQNDSSNWKRKSTIALLSYRSYWKEFRFTLVVKLRLTIKFSIASRFYISTTEIRISRSIAIFVPMIVE